MKSFVGLGPFVMASVLTSYPDEGFAEAVGSLLQDDTIILPPMLKKNLEELLVDSNKLQDLRSEYVEIFDLSKLLNPLYETEYGRERAMFKANELSDISGFYHAFGFELDQDGTKEMLDHVSVELEFYSLLLMKHIYLAEHDDIAGCEIVFDGMKRFMDAHLGRFVASIAERDGVKNSIFYKELFDWVSELVNDECERIGVKPEKAKWFSSQAEGDVVCCGAAVPINKQIDELVSK